MKVGIVGLGARITHMANLFKQAQPDMDFVAFADPTPAGQVFLEGKLGHEMRPYDALEDMLSAEPLDCVMIGSPNYLHLEHLQQVLEADVPYIFAEKPVVISEDETFALLNLLKKHDGEKRIIIGLVLRYSPLYVALKAAQADGHLGDIVSMEASEHITPYHGAFFMQDWRRYSKLSGGFMLEKCCHDLDLYQGVVGARATRVASFGSRRSFVPENKPDPMPDYEAWARSDVPHVKNHLYPFTPRWGGSNAVFESDADIVDNQTAIVEYETGASLAFHTNTNVPDEFRRFAVMGTKGMAEGDFVRNTFALTDARYGQSIPHGADLAPGRANHYGADDMLVQDALAFMEHGAPLKVSVLDALEVGLTALAMDIARLERRMVDLTPLWERFDSYGLTKEACT